MCSLQGGCVLSFSHIVSVVICTICTYLRHSFTGLVERRERARETDSKACLPTYLPTYRPRGARVFHVPHRTGHALQVVSFLPLLPALHDVTRARVRACADRCVHGGRTDGLTDKCGCGCGCDVACLPVGCPRDSVDECLFKRRKQ